MRASCILGKSNSGQQANGPMPCGHWIEFLLQTWAPASSQSSASMVAAQIEGASDEARGGASSPQTAAKAGRFERQAAADVVV